MSQVTPKQRSRRLDLRALIVVGVVALVAAPGLMLLKSVQDRRGRTALLREAKDRLQRDQTALALGYLKRYLELEPGDTDALDLEAKVLASNARTEAEALEAAQILNQVLGRDPDDPRRQETRRRLVKMNLMIRGRARAVEAQARELIRRGGDDAEAHRLLARALEQIGGDGTDPAALEEARAEYEAAERKAPGDVEGAERLAVLFRDRLENPEKAEVVLDQAVAVTAPTPAKHAKALLARARHFTAVHQPEKAASDVERAIEDAPGDVEVRLAAAEVELQRRQPTAARQHLAAIAAQHREDLRVRVAEGLIDLVEQRPEDAIQAWRLGLRRIGGNDAELTWRLAHVLLEIGRVGEAEPLIAQYRRLVGGEAPNPRYRYLRALALLATNRPGEAVAELEAIRYKVDKPLEPHVGFALGRACESTRNPGKALEAYRQAAELSRDWSAPWLAVARAQLAAQPAEAVATLRRGLALNRDDPSLLAALGQVLWREQARKPAANQSWEEAAEIIDAAKKAGPASPDVALTEADYLTARGRPEDAIAVLTAATRLNPKSAELWLARASALVRRGRLGQALEILDDAVTAAGPRAGFFISRASVLVIKGDVSKAKSALVDGLDRVPDEQKPLLWKTLGEFHQARKDYASAHLAFEEWAKRQPDNPDPRIALFELALARGDDDAIARAVEEVRKVGGPKEYYWRFARVEDLLRDRPTAKDEPATHASRLAEAEALIAEIEANDPQLPLGYLLEGRLGEKRGDLDKAVSAYMKALEHDAGPLALTPLVALLVRDRRDADLDRLRETLAAMPGDLERLAAIQALRLGETGRAEALAARAALGDSRGLDVHVWQAEVLRALGKPEEVDAALQRMTAERPNDLAPWLELLMLQLSLRQADKAAATVERIRKQVATDYPELLWAMCYRAIGDARRADQCYQEAIKRWPDELGVFLSAISFYEEAGRRDDAEAGLRVILRRDKGNPSATRRLAQSLASHAGNRAAWEEALALIGREPRPDDVPDDLVARASVYAQGPLPAHRARAIAILEGLLADLPDLAAVHEKAARLLLAAGQPARARGHSTRAAAGDQASADAILFHAGVLLALKEVDAAEHELDRLASLDPEGLPVAELRARVLAARGEGKQAAEGLERAFDARADAADGTAVAEKMVRLLLTLNQPEAAERVARRCAATSPKGACILAELIAGRGKDGADEAAALLESAAKKGEPAAAGAVALSFASAPNADARWLPLAERLLTQAAAKEQPASFELHQKLALLRHFQGRYKDEMAVYQSLLAMNPDNCLFINNLAWTLSEEMGQAELGRKWADEAVRRCGELPLILDTRGVILTRLGRFDEAVRDLSAAARDYPVGPVYYHLARAYKKQGKLDDFQAARDRARKLGIGREQLQPSELAAWDEVMNP